MKRKELGAKFQIDRGTFSRNRAIKALQAVGNRDSDIGRRFGMPRQRVEKIGQLHSYQEPEVDIFLKFIDRLIGE